jgi:hypothetical protein
MFNHKCTLAIYTTSKTENLFVQNQQFFPHQYRHTSTYLYKIELLTSQEGKFEGTASTSPLLMLKSDRSQS